MPPVAPELDSASLTAIVSSITSLCLGYRMFRASRINRLNRTATHSKKMAFRIPECWKRSFVGLRLSLGKVLETFKFNRGSPMFHLRLKRLLSVLYQTP